MKKGNALIEFSVIPIGADEHLSGSVARCTQKIRASGIKSELHAMGTNLEGDLDQCMDLIRQCLEEVMQDAPRASATIKVDLRADGETDMKKRVQSVEDKVSRL